ncbi:MAG: Tetratricopeptide repeat protein [candidate division BRC1 bacterium ADurb.BinA292]|nr:MAG: Tetratricopeptide repeat protein [candidate division BRC1 bacterium ADurb.BinA292]
MNTITLQEIDTKEAQRNPPYNDWLSLRSYPAFGWYHVQLGEFQKAKTFFQSARDRWFKNGDPYYIAEWKLEFAIPHYYAGEFKEARELFRDAAGLNAGRFVVFEAKLSRALTMLARTEEKLGNFDAARQAHEQSVATVQPIRPGSGMYRIERADALCQYGSFLLRQNEPAEARLAFQEAIQLREATATATHPDYAVALLGLADVAAYQDELTTARLHAQKAIEVLETALVPTHPRFAPALVTGISIYYLAGEDDKAEAMLPRLESILGSALGPEWDPFAAAIKHYIGILESEGQGDAAARLKELAERELRVRRETAGI